VEDIIKEAGAGKKSRRGGTKRIKAQHPRTHTNANNDMRRRTNVLIFCTMSPFHGIL
jgi:hypothetical protein